LVLTKKRQCTGNAESLHKRFEWWLIYVHPSPTCMHADLCIPPSAIALHGKITSRDKALELARSLLAERWAPWWRRGYAMCRCKAFKALRSALVAARAGLPNRPPMAGGTPDA
jgi:hypothetical protein